MRADTFAQMNKAAKCALTLRTGLLKFQAAAADIACAARSRSAAKALFDNIWVDLSDFSSRKKKGGPTPPGDTAGVEVLWKHLPSPQKAAIEEFVSEGRGA